MLQAAADGDRQATDELLPLLYDELRRLARARLAHVGPGQTLQPTALVHEAYLKLLRSDAGWDGRRHFFAAAARAMREILVDRARRRAAIRHGGEQRRVDDKPDIAIEEPKEDLLALDEALRRLEADDPRKGQIVSLRYFAGLTAAETAEMLGVTERTIEREWRYIKTWLRRELTVGGPPAASSVDDSTAGFRRLEDEAPSDG